MLAFVVVDVNLKCPLSVNLFDTIHASKITNGSLDRSHGFRYPCTMRHVGDRPKQQRTRTQLSDAGIRRFIRPLAVVKIGISRPHSFVEQCLRKMDQHGSFPEA